MPCQDRYPRPCWEHIAKRIQDLAPTDEDALWWDVAVHWVTKTCVTAGPDYRLDRSGKFVLGSTLEPSTAHDFLEFANRCRRRILDMLVGLATTDGLGPHVVLVFKSQDDYYDYIAPFYPAAGHFAASSGVHLNPGYGHFAIPLADLGVMEAVVAHELTHSLLSHLPLPRWMDEGIAVNVESILCPQSRRRLSTDWMRRHRQHWNKSTVQEYWFGKAFSRSDEISELSYELAWVMVKHMSRDYGAFRKFASDATYQDAGQEAALKHLGVDLASFITALLGNGDWDPLLRE